MRSVIVRVCILLGTVVATTPLYTLYWEPRSSDKDFLLNLVLLLSGALVVRIGIDRIVYPPKKRRILPHQAQNLRKRARVFASHGLAGVGVYAAIMTGYLPDMLRVVYENPFFTCMFALAGTSAVLALFEAIELYIDAHERWR